MNKSAVPVDGSHWLAGELEMPASCLACGSDELIPCHVGLEDLLGQVPGTWGFVECAECRSLQLAPRPTEESVAKAYPPSYVTHSNVGEEAAGENGSGLVWALVNGYLNRRFGSTRSPSSFLGRYVLPLALPVRQQMDYFFRHLPPRPGRLLDVGCGHGAFLERAQGAGWEVEGIEPDPAAASVATLRGLQVSVCSIDKFTPEGKYDRITLSHVCEHLHNPSRELATLHGWLRGGGELWMAMPNPGGVGHRLFGRNWFSLDPPRHILLAPSAVIEKMLKAAGFSSIRFIRRGRGSQSSLAPSMDYRRRRLGTGSPLVAKFLSIFVDLLSSIFVSSSEEIVVLAKRTRSNERD